MPFDNDNKDNRNNVDDFEKLLLESEKQPGDVYYRPGDKVPGEVVLISGDTIFIDFGGKGEGWTEVEEFTDENGKVTVSVGDKVNLLLLEFGPQGAHLGTRFRQSGSDGVDMSILEEAFKSSLPVEGSVSSTNKGGFDIDVSGVHAFCPISQIEAGFVEEPEVFVGQTLSFKIIEFDEDDNRVVLSRRALLEEEREKAAVETRTYLEVGAVFNASVRKIMPYGVFMDIGGVDGFLHMSQIAHEHVEHPKDKISEGERYDVKVLSIETDAKGRERIGLSIKALLKDPWETGLPFESGDTVTGVVRRIEDFGAFVELAPGVDGLLHVSEIALERIDHPSDKLTPDQEVEVLIKQLDTQQRRISLSIRELLLPKTPVPELDHKDEIESQRKGNVISRKKKMILPEDEPLPQNVSPEDQWLEAEKKEEPKEKYQMPRMGLKTTGVIGSIMPYGVFINLPDCGPESRGLCHKSELTFADGEKFMKNLKEGDPIEVEIIRIDESGRLGLSHKSVVENNERQQVASFQKKLKAETSMGKMADIFKNIKLDKK